MKKINKIISLISALLILISVFALPVSAASSKKTSPSTVYTAVKKAYGKDFPLTSKSKTVSSAQVGVSKKYYTSYYGKYQGTKTPYIIYIAEAKDKKCVKKIKNALKDYVATESASMGNYLSKTGKKLYSNAKVGSSGLYVYLVMLDTSANKTAVKAIKKATK